MIDANSTLPALDAAEDEQAQNYSDLAQAQTLEMANDIRAKIKALQETIDALD